MYLHKLYFRRGRRDYEFMLTLAASFATFWSPLLNLARLSRTEEEASHILLIPLICFYLIYKHREKVFATSHPRSSIFSIAVVLGGFSIAVLGWHFGKGFSNNDALALTIPGIILVWWGAFIACYGYASFRAALFPMLFLMLMIPIPTVVVHHAIDFLQRGSADLAEILFNWSGAPVDRHDIYFFDVGSISIEVAKTCSGIHSSLALFIMSLLIGNFALHSAWARTITCLLSVPIAIFKNAVRIVSLTLLSVYVEPSFLTGRLHHDGGMVFFVLGLFTLGGCVKLLRLAEKPKQTAPTERLGQMPVT
jgi:exosortase